MVTTAAGQDDRALPGPGRDVVGRAREVAAIEAFLDAGDRLPRALVIEGEAGIGKTTLWHRATDGARARGYVVVEARPVGAEAQLAFAGLGDLLADAFAAVGTRLPEPQQHALGVALLLDQPGESAHDPRTVGVAVLSTLRLLADARPVLLAIDDEQWLDPTSAATLGFALRRLRSEPVAVLLARRPGDEGSVARLRLEGRIPVEQVDVGPVSIGALHAIVAERFATVLTRPRLRRLHELSRGNPYLAIELARAAQTGQLLLDSAEPVSVDLGRLLGARLDALPGATRTALLAAAAASHPTVELLDLVTGRDVRPLLAPAVDAGVIEPVGTEVRFTHPLLASAAFGAVTAEERRQMHATLARAVEDREERARHAALAAIEPDESVALEVERAAEATFRRGAPVAAAELADQAVRLTRPDEPDGRRRRAAARAEYLFGAGDTSAAGQLLDSVIEATPRGRTRAALLALQARIRHFGNDIASGVDANRRALAEAGRDDGLRAGIHEGLAWGLFLMRADLRAAERHARSAVLSATRAGDDVALAESLAALAITSLAIGRPASEAMDAAMALEPALVDLRVLRHPSYARGYVLACTDRLDEAATVFADLLTRAEEHGDESAVPPILVQLSLVEILSGDWTAADEHARTGHALALQTGQRPSAAALLGRSALLAALRGRLDEAEGLGEQALSGGAGGSADLDTALARAPLGGGEIAAWALGAAALAAGRHERAIRCLQPLADTLLGAGMRDPGELRFLPDAVEALVGLERLDVADALVGRMEAMARASTRPTAVGIAARCRAIVAARRGDLDAALEAAGRAVGLLDGGPLPLEVARARLVLGEIQRRTRRLREARVTLVAAIDGFDRLGAVGWAERARAEAARVGGRAASTGDLTPTEHRVAELVAEGLANKEVAHALAIGQKTVELHLSHVYAKLGVGSRTELVRRWSAGPSAADGGKP